ncbi:MAG: hypothetical protein PHY92_10925 [Alphaproteobacteria bacterium]|nr:hypothetical protein [Alphaproteobacteria bacterium]
MSIARAIPNASKLELDITNDLLLARAILLRLHDPVAEKLNKAQTHLGSIVHGVPMKPARDFSDKKSVIYIAKALREAAGAIGGYGRTPLPEFFPPARNEEEADEREWTVISKDEEGNWIVFRGERTVWDLAVRLMEHADYLDRLLVPPYRPKLAPLLRDKSLEERQALTL